jgi:hypothetical protein
LSAAVVATFFRAKKIELLDPDLLPIVEASNVGQLCQGCQIFLGATYQIWEKYTK